MDILDIRAVEMVIPIIFLIFKWFLLFRSLGVGQEFVNNIKIKSA